MCGTHPYRCAFPCLDKETSTGLPWQQLKEALYGVLYFLTHLD